MELTVAGVRVVLSGMRVAGERRGPEAKRAGVALLQSLVRELTGAESTIGRRCDVCGSDQHGRPVATEAVRLSLSYAEGAVIAAAALTAEAAAIGIDIERADDAQAQLTELATLFAPRPAPSLERKELAA